jgi:hypothetical protein
MGALEAVLDGVNEPGALGRDTKFGLPKAFSGDPTCTATLWVIKPGGVSVVQKNSRSPQKPVGTLYETIAFTIVSAQNGSVRFKNPTVFRHAKSNRVPLASGPQTGWVHAQYVSVDTKFRYPDRKTPELILYDSPFEDGRPVVRWTPSDRAGPNGKNWRGIDEVLGCIGGWLKVELRDASQTSHIGWLHPENQCANQRTNCG